MCMDIQARLLDPVCVRIGRNFNVVVSSDDEKNDCSLETGVLFRGEHYGFVLIVDDKNIQREFVYSTQCKIEAIGIENGILKIFEYGKKSPWYFSKNGTVQQNPHNQFTDEFVSEYRSKVNLTLENYNMFMGEGSMLNPVQINIARSPEESTILINIESGEEVPLYPGVMFDPKSARYGFTLIMDRPEGILEVHYPTQNMIDAIGFEGGKIKIYESGKYFPWILSQDGQVLKKSGYNSMSRRDKEFVRECCAAVLENGNKDAVTLQKKI